MATTLHDFCCPLMNNWLQILQVVIEDVLSPLKDEYNLNVIHVDEITNKNRKLEIM